VRQEEAEEAQAEEAQEERRAQPEGEAMTAVRRIPVRGRRVTLATVLAVVLLLALGAGSAQAVRSHPTPTSFFGPDGTATSEYCSMGALDIDQTNRHLYTYGSECGIGYGIQGFQLESSTARTPLGGNFPIGQNEPNDSSIAAADGPGNIYSSPGPFQIYGFKDNGESAGTRYPLYLEEEYICSLATDSKGDVWVSIYEPAEIKEFSPAGVEMRRVKPKGGPYCAMDLDSTTDDLYLSNESGPVRRFTAASEYTRSVEVMPDYASNIAVDSKTGIVYAVVNNEGSQEVKAVRESGAPVEEFGVKAGGYSINDVAVDESDETVYISRFNGVEVFAAGAIIADVATGPVSSATGETATISATVDTAGGPEIETCEFQYGEEAGALTKAVPCEQATPFTGSQTVTAKLANLQSGRRYYYRIVVETENGESVGAVRQATVAAAPTIEGLFSSHVTESTAELTARINPQGSATTYHFEYGTTAAYGSEAPIGGAGIGGSQDAQTATVNLAALGSGTYHFRVVASNEFGTTVSPDQTFNFYPPECPNAHIRQQTGGSYLPDCRAYELVSPGNANGVIMFPEDAPDAPYATNPPRYPFDAALGVIPGTEATNAVGVDTYIATRTDTGWVTTYSGLKGSEVLGATNLIGDLGFDKVLDIRFEQDFGGVPQPRDVLPFVWDSQGNFLERWPANMSTIPGAANNFGAYQSSPDFSHFAFTSMNVAFTPNGKVEAPGSAYDYNVANHTTTLISLLPNGQPIPQNPASFSPYEFITFAGQPVDNSVSGVARPLSANPVQDHPSVSTDGSHILMSTTEGGPETGLVKLYMRVNDAVTYLVSKNHAVKFVGMTSDGKHVYFTSTEQILEGQDTDEGNDLYEWSEATDSLTLLSANSSVGNGNSCVTSWTTKCGIEVAAGTAKTDYPIATESGDIYFYSPEQLAGVNHGIPNRRNLYVYRHGEIQYVTTLGNGSSESARRIQVSPDGLHMAFVTSTRIGSYDNVGYEEMYSFEPETKKLVCVSCLPDGETPTADVEASVDGLFMSNDGRTFFYTPDPLVPRDTDGINDVYEYTEGQAQLISSGTAAADQTLRAGNSRPGGLEGVSADGMNVYFATYETLVPQDENGQFLKFYDARVNGGFPFTPPPTACEAADECHGEGSVAPVPAQVVSENGIGAGGNFAHKKAKHKKKKHKKKAQKKKKKAKAPASNGKKNKSSHGSSKRKGTR
jgi:hypothetical protein